MTKYQNYHDCRVGTKDGQVRWVDHGEIRFMDSDEAMWLARQLASAAVEAGGQE